MKFYDSKQVDGGVDRYYECDCNIIGIREIRKGNLESTIRFTDSNGNDITLKNCVDILHANVCVEKKLKFLEKQKDIYHKEDIYVSLLRDNVYQICTAKNMEEKMRLYFFVQQELNSLLELEKEKLELFRKIEIDK